ncbi:MAG: hypothetical protein KGZ40_01215 [Clostridiales bacterium]|nr:hypothetical protein [Clostridiales bacterium]
MSEPYEAPLDRVSATTGHGDGGSRKSVATRAVDLVDTIYAREERERRRESLEEVLGKAKAESA